MKEQVHKDDGADARSTARADDRRLASGDVPMLAIVIPVDPDEPVRVEPVPADRAQRSETYRAWVQGWLEVVELREPGASLYINEEGKIRQMPVNQRATALAWLHCPGFRGRDLISGPAFLVGPVQENGEDGSVPDGLIHLVANTGLLQVQEGLDAVPTGWRVMAYHRTWLAAYRTAMMLRRNVGLARVVPSADPETLMQWIGRREEILPEPSNGMSTPETTDILSCPDSVDLAHQILWSDLRAGQMFSLRDLCLLNVSAGGGKWLALRSGRTVSVPPLRSLITAGQFTDLVGRLLRATANQLDRGDY